MTRVLLPTAAFERSVKRYASKHPASLPLIRETLARLEADAFEPRLRTHKLKGPLAEDWASSAGYDLRIVFRLMPHEGSEAILLLSVGTHDEVY